MTDFKQLHWFLKDLKYEYLDDGFKIVVTTDVPCHLYCRMTTTPPRKHALPSYRRGLYLQGDIRFCFVVYEDNEQDESGDTLTHTWLKDAWPVCEMRWFYFVGTIAGQPSVSESPIFKFHFPGPPPVPPPPMLYVFNATLSNRTLTKQSASWAAARNAAEGDIHPQYAPPLYKLWAGDRLVTLYGVWRGFLFFDTSDLPDTFRIQSAFLNLFVIDAHLMNEPTLKAIVITEGRQNDPILKPDYWEQLWWQTHGGERDIDTLVTNAYNSINFNDAGLLWINPTGITRVCLRSERDIHDIMPTTSQRMISFHSAQKGTPFIPQLHVYYYPA